MTDLLARYGTILQKVAADPGGAPPPGTPTRAEWDSVVLPGSPLYGDVLGRFHQRATVDRVVITPGPQGVTFRHTATAARSDSESSISFEWCGWSPGIGRRIDDGTVVDDVVAHTTGVGTIERHGGQWLLVTMEELDRSTAEPGSPDRCEPT